MKFKLLLKWYYQTRCTRQKVHWSKKINRGIYHLIGQDYGPKVALDMIYNMQQVVLSFLNMKAILSVLKIYCYL